MKKALPVIIVLLLAGIISFYVMPVKANNEVTVTINNEEIIFEHQPPVIVNGRTLVPVREVFEHLGFTPTWNSQARTAILERAGYTIVITIGSEIFTTNGIEHSLDVYARIINGTTMLPLRAVLESIGITPYWDASTSTITIETQIQQTFFACNDEYLMHALMYGRNPSRGVWEGNAYISEYMGFWFYMPSAWVAAPNGVLRQISQLRDGREMPTEGTLLTDELLAYINGISTADMIISNYYTGASVIVSFTRLLYPEVPRFASPNRSLTPPRTELAELINVPGTVRLGAYYWHLFSYEWGSRRDTITGTYVYTHRHQFVNVQGLFARSIVIFVNNYSESLEDILNMFGDINTTPTPASEPVLPERITWQRAMWPIFEPPQANHPIIDTWTREDDYSYFYVFENNGFGSSDSSMFLWIVDGNQLKRFAGWYLEEQVYTFTIEGDILTLEGSNSYRFTRGQHPLIGTWVLEDIDSVTYSFWIDGSGNISAGRTRESISWVADGNQVKLFIDGYETIYLFSINGDILTFAYSEFLDEYYRLIREDEPVWRTFVMPNPSPPPACHPLIGRWIDEDYEIDIIIFKADGTGANVSFPTLGRDIVRKEPFVWTVEEDVLTLYFEFSGAEKGLFVIDGNILILAEDGSSREPLRLIRQ